MFRLNRYTKVTFLILFAAVLLALAPAWDGAGSTAHATASIDTRLGELNTLRALSRIDWGAQYDTLRREPAYSWMDWSQDACSTPHLVPTAYNDDFREGCLRHDLSWRTMAVADAGTGRV